MKVWIQWSVALLLVLGTEAWFFWPAESWEFQWEPLLAFMTALAAFVVIERQALKGSSGPKQADISLFTRYNEVSVGGEFSFFREHDFGGSFRSESLDPLRRLLRLNENIEYKFSSPTLEAIRVQVVRSAKELDTLLAQYLSYTNGSVMKVLPEVPHEEQEKRRVVKAINDKATEFYNLYSSLINLGRSELGESSPL